MVSTGYRSVTISLKYEFYWNTQSSLQHTVYRFKTLDATLSLFSIAVKLWKSGLLAAL